MIRLTTVLVAVAILASALGLIWAFQRSLMYFPFAHVPDPASLGLSRVERVTFATTDAITLHGWFFESAQPAVATVLVCNGNAGNLSYRAGLASALRAHGLQVLLFDYRGYGESAGSPTEAGLAADARAARAYVLGRDDVRGMPLVYFGESLGAAVATELAEAHPPAGLVLRSPFTSMIDMGRLHYPILPVRWMLRDRYPSIDRIARIQAPLLVVAGDRDRIIPIENTRRLYDAAVSPGKRLVVVPGADHNDAELADGPSLIDATVAFVKTLQP